MSVLLLIDVEESGPRLAWGASPASSSGFLVVAVGGQRAGDGGSFFLGRGKQVEHRVIRFPIRSEIRAKVDPSVLRIVYVEVLHVARFGSLPSGAGALTREN